MRVRWSRQKEAYGKELISNLFDEDMIQTYFRHKKDGWILRNGDYSPYYIQTRPLTSKRTSQSLLKLCGDALGDLLEEETRGITKVIGGSLTGISIATSITLSCGIPSCNAKVIPKGQNIDQFIKEECDDYSPIEGDIEEGDKLAIIDDIATDFSTKNNLLKLVNNVGEIKSISLDCNDVIVLIDREQGSKEAANKLGINLYSLIPFKTKGIHWLYEDNKLNEQEYADIVDYLDDPDKYQNENMQKKIMSHAI